MRKKKLLTAALCAVLMLASCAVSGITNAGVLNVGKIQSVVAEETSSAKEDEPAPAAETPPSQKATEAPATEPPKATEAPAAEPPKVTEAPATEPPKETDPPVTEPPKVPETTAPETSETPVQTENPPAGTEGTVETPSTQMPTETLPSETMPGTEQTPETELVPGTEGLPGETAPSTEETGSETETLPTETMTDAEHSTETSEKESETDEETESETSLYSSNEELIAHQNIVIPPDIALEFRFTQVEKQYAIVADRQGAPVYEEKSEDAREVGVLEYYGCCYILKKEEDWYFVESGNVRGFVKADQVVTDEVADRIVSVKGLEKLPEARLLVARSENEAFAYTHTTIHEVIADKVYAVASKEVGIYEQRKESANKTGVLPEGALCYILADDTEEWVFAESSDARGFVKKSALLTGTAAQKLVNEQGEENMEMAQMLVAPENNKSCYYTMTSVKPASQEAMTREAIVNFAIQFVGNPYVWGGTSLTNGADCSGFVQSVYAQFGYYLPRVAEAQAGYGMQIPVSSAEPGDLIFYARNGYVYHVSMYMGNGKVVHAAGRKVGIITSGISGDAVWATRIIKG